MDMQLSFALLIKTHTHIPRLLTSVSLFLVASGRYHPGKDKPDPKTWKANFRCALNSLPDVCELHEHSRKRGNNAFRVYRMMPSMQPRRRRRGDECICKESKPVQPAQWGQYSCDQLTANPLSLSGLRLFSRSEARPPRLHDAAEGEFSAWQPCSTITISEPTQKDDTPSEDSLDNCQLHSEALLLLVLSVVWWWWWWWWVGLSSCRDVGGQTRRAGAGRGRLQRKPHSG